MKLSTRTKYGTRALMTLALAEDDRVMSTREVADKQDISFKYLEQIMSALRAGGLVNSRRGQSGGYTLSRQPEKINLLQVYRVLEGSTAPSDCVDNPETCSLGCACPTRETWAEIGRSIREVLENTTLRELVERHRQKQRDGSITYHI